MNMEHLSTFFGMSTVSVLHSLLPTHWLPFSVVGRAHGWTLGKTLLITAVGGTCHVISTTLLGWTAATMATAVLSEESIHMMASMLLVVMGLVYILQFRFGCGHHHHHRATNHSVERMAIIGLILVPTLSPCATTLPVFLTAASSDDKSEFLVLAGLLWCSTLSVMLVLVSLSYVGVARLKGAVFEGISRYDKLAVGSCLCVVGVLTQLTHHHDGDGHEHAHAHAHGHL
mmetsp:Transcript_19363/g.32545  ORF Transcript_19363/g.32545 Transcript_19363/m.32545 type:complete len:229 (+) Transcript_19363:428-1114(+)|eukprot:CAMPEP_0198201850 /NCGR_PEP_ID=MMETSP1445-20131203/4879_1 /TAXON_ID=36898 /ORGANISM="Pyramimonas sp., Strain CCMP2087" /LENGTH=228 /DNA_ID=CAMNT_0043872487 /DNA_START=418 /DNA_END=1104 /DNA_ORIENTATION=-